MCICLSTDSEEIQLVPCASASLPQAGGSPANFILFCEDGYGWFEFDGILCTLAFRLWCTRTLALYTTPYLVVWLLDVDIFAFASFERL